MAIFITSTSSTVNVEIFGSLWDRYSSRVPTGVITERFETAREAAHLIEVSYARESPTAGFDKDGTEIVELATVDKKHEDPSSGDADAELRQDLRKRKRPTGV